MCSECAKGTSSVFGSFRCQKCSHGWIVLVLIFALAGVLIIALLFLFNFTILQETIQGIVLYANTLVLLGDFYEEYGVKYLYIPMALMNFDLGFETCFFNGMNEFSKAFLQFAFPLYIPVHPAHNYCHCCTQVWPQNLPLPLHCQTSCPSSSHHHAADIHRPCRSCHHWTEVHHHLQCLLRRETCGVAEPAWPAVLQRTTFGSRHPLPCNGPPLPHSLHVHNAVWGPT